MLSIIIKPQNALEVPDNEAEQNCEAKAYLKYVEQAIEVPTKLNGAYMKFYLLSAIALFKSATSSSMSMP